MTTLASAEERNSEPVAVTLSATESNQPQIQRLPVESWPSDGVLRLKGPLPSIIKIWSEGDPDKTPVEFGFNADATEVQVYAADGSRPAAFHCLISEPTATFADGSIVISALDGEVVGKVAKLESHPGTYRIGYWSKAEDYVRWEHEIKAGKYDVELVYSRAPKKGTEMTFQFGDQSLVFTPKQTGTWYRYRVDSIGQLDVAATGKQEIAAKVSKMTQGVINLKAIVLTPVE